MNNNIKKIYQPSCNVDTRMCTTKQCYRSDFQGKSQHEVASYPLVFKLNSTAETNNKRVPNAFHYNVTNELIIHIAYNKGKTQSTNAFQWSHS